MTSASVVRFLVPIVGGLCLVGVSSAAPVAAQTVMVDVKPNGDPGKGGVDRTSISKDGSKVAFSSWASDLVKGDTNGAVDVFVRTFQTGKTIRISVSSAEQQSNGHSFFPQISGNGRYVVFQSDATNLVPHDGNGDSDVFRRDLIKGVTELVSSDPITPDDRVLSSVPGASTVPSISFDGQEVGFVSTASAKALVGDTYTDTNRQPDVFLRKWTADAPRGLTNLISHRSDSLFRAANGNSGGVVSGTQLGASVSDNGQFIAFGSTATLIDTDSKDANGPGADIFWSTRSRAVSLVSKSKAGVQGNGDHFTPSLSADGCAVAFWSTSNNLITGDTNNGTDIFVKDLCDDHEVLRANLNADGTQDFGGAQPLQSGALSDDGYRVTFASFGQLTEPKNCGGEQVYVRKFDASQTIRISDTRTGRCGDRFSNYAAISGNGKFVSWVSASDSLVLGDTNANSDIFRRGAI